MKLYKNLPLFAAILICSLFSSCENQSFSFDDYEGGTSVYFAYQYPVRTIVLGEDEYDTTLDNQHKCKIYATMGGVYENKKNIRIDIKTDNSLCNNLFYEDGTAVKAMPAEYYTLADNKISLNKAVSNGVEVQLTDAFFADPDALKNTYVIPVVMTGVSGADRILDGTPIVDGTTPDRCNSSLWDVKPMDYVLYCVKYINQWHAYYLRRGVDQITENGVTTTEVRHNKYVEDDEVMMLTTNTLKSVLLPVSTRVRNEATGSTETLTCDLILTFNDNNECVITSSSEYPASGSGKFVSKGEKKSWGNKDRDVIYLDYQIDFSGKKYVTKDTLVVRNRGVSVEEFTPSYVE